MASVLVVALANVRVVEFFVRIGSEPTPSETPSFWLGVSRSASQYLPPEPSYLSSFTAMYPSILPVCT
jgi:hypothetical protein